MPREQWAWALWVRLWLVGQVPKSLHKHMSKATWPRPARRLHPGGGRAARRRARLAGHAPHLGSRGRRRARGADLHARVDERIYAAADGAHTVVQQLALHRGERVDGLRGRGGGVGELWGVGASCTRKLRMCRQWCQAVCRERREGDQFGCKGADMGGQGWLGEASQRENEKRCLRGIRWAGPEACRTLGGAAAPHTLSKAALLTHPLAAAPQQYCDPSARVPTLKTASTGPAPTAPAVRTTPSGPFMMTVAVGLPMLPHTT